MTIEEAVNEIHRDCSGPLGVNEEDRGKLFGILGRLWTSAFFAGRKEILEAIPFRKGDWEELGK
jgi:hypothetical protein